MTVELMSASEAFTRAYVDSVRVKHRSSPFACPYPDCRAYAEHYWGTVSIITVNTGALTYQDRDLIGSELHVALCSSCNRDVIFLDGKLVKPAASEAPPPASDMPSEIIAEYNEAAAILPNSPRGSAALLRLAVQKLLPIIGAKKRDINDQIGELVANRVISGQVQTALDALRVIGNEAVHPGTIDLRDDSSIAMGLFRLLNFIIEKAISDPKHAQEMFALIPQAKREAIAKRDTTPLE